MLKARTPPPGYAALRDLGLVRYREGRFQEAADLFARALRLNDKSASLHAAAGAAFSALGRLGEAAARYGKAATLEPGNAEILTDLGTAQLAVQQAEAAITSFRRAIAARPDHVPAHLGLGEALEALGRPDEAAEAFRAAVSLAPRSGLAHRRLAECRRISPDDPQLSDMMSLIAQAGALPKSDRVHLHAALAKAHEDLGRHDEAFRHVLDGNRIQRDLFVYDEPETVGLLARIAERFTPQLMAQKAGMGHPSAAPVFIVGMPRSGSTLVEQILASHPQVFGAGEIRNFDTAVEAMGLGRFGSEGFFQKLPSLERRHFYRLGAGYVASLEAVPKAATRVTNKLLGNFLYAGLIHLALPNARIVHVVRDPVDTCVSRFSRLMVPGQSYSYDLAELGRYHRAYEDLMAHWNSVLPPGVMLEIRYEDIVADLEGEARRLLDFCGLAWDPACLAFHATQRLVMTPSKSQVRQPLYDSAVGRWRRHAEALRPLLEALDRA